MAALSWWNGPATLAWSPLVREARTVSVVEGGRVCVRGVRRRMSVGAPGWAPQDIGPTKPSVARVYEVLPRPVAQLRVRPRVRAARAGRLSRPSTILWDKSGLPAPGGTAPGRRGGGPVPGPGFRRFRRWETCKFVHPDDAPAFWQRVEDLPARSDEPSAVEEPSTARTTRRGGRGQHSGAAGVDGGGAPGRAGAQFVRCLRHDIPCLCGAGLCGC